MSKLVRKRNGLDLPDDTPGPFLVSVGTCLLVTLGLAFAFVCVLVRCWEMWVR
jgi:hypothetical protein